MRHLPVALVLLCLSAKAEAASLAAQLAPPHVVAGESALIRIITTDEHQLIGSIVVHTRPKGATEWAATEARRLGNTWTAEISPSLIPPAGESLEIQVSLLGHRSGLLLKLGDDEPFETPVLTKAFAERQLQDLRGALARVETKSEDEVLVGFVGAEARAGTSARARAVVGAGLLLGSAIELLFASSIGPAFARPALLRSGGPVVLGPEVALRGYVSNLLGARSWIPFAELVAGADVRFPGIDPMVMARIGGTRHLANDVSLDLSIGGGFVAFRSIDGDQSTVGGATGNARVSLRFDARADAPE